MFVLEADGGSIGRDELLERTGLSESTIDRSLRRLEDADVIRRDRDADDVRFVRVKMNSAVETTTFRQR